MGRAAIMDAAGMWVGEESPLVINLVIVWLYD